MIKQLFGKKLTNTLCFKQIGSSQSFSVSNQLQKISLPQITFNSAQYSHSVKYYDENSLEKCEQLSQNIKENLQKYKSEWLYQDDNLILLRYHQIKQTDAQKSEIQATLAEQGAKTTRSLTGRKIKQCDIQLPKDYDAQEVSSFLRGMMLANYQFDLKSYIQPEKSKASEENKSETQATEEKQGFTPLESINIVQHPEAKELSQNLLEFTKQISQATLNSRELGNTRANVANPQFIFNLAKDFAEKNSSQVKMVYLKGEQIEKEGLRLAYAVGKASQNQSYVVHLSYNGNQDKTEVLGLVGKGVCFDAGGLNIKPTGSMQTMYMDQSGAVNVFNAFKAAVQLNMKVNLTCTIGLVENFIGSNSYRPSDVITSLKGITVEIGNTDAEGRLVLADIMTWSQRMNKPTVMLELSTLTGACVVALGETTAGLFTNCDDLEKQLLESSQEVGESLWRLPLNEEFREKIKGDVADISNSGKGRWGGASTAACFLEKFVQPDVKWAHIDIAGPAEAQSDKGVICAGVTGFGVQTLLNFANQF